MFLYKPHPWVVTTLRWKQALLLEESLLIFDRTWYVCWPSCSTSFTRANFPCIPSQPLVLPKAIWSFNSTPTYRISSLVEAIEPNKVYNLAMKFILIFLLFIYIFHWLSLCCTPNSSVFMTHPSYIPWYWNPSWII